MRIVHAADLHLDSPLRGIARLEDAPVDTFRVATRRAFDGLVDLCVHRRSELLLLAGDVFDGDLRDHHAGIHFGRGLRRLAGAGCRVVVVHGNHDAACSVTRTLSLPENVHVLGHRAPESVAFEELGVVVHGQSYAAKAEDRNLAAGYPDPTPGMLNLGLLHTNATGSTEHAAYAPCTVADLVGRGYDYWALGHVHGHAVLHRAPWVVYPGNLQGRHARETGPKGAVVIEVDDGAIVDVAFEPLDVVRWERVRLDASEASGLDELLDAAGAAFASVRAAADGREVIARVELVGATPLHDAMSSRLERFRDEVRARALETGNVWTEKIVLATTPAPEHEGVPRDDFRAAVEAELAALAADDDAVDALRRELKPFAAAVAPHVAVRPDDRGYLRLRLASVEALLRARLFGEEAGT